MSTPGRASPAACETNCQLVRHLSAYVGSEVPMWSIIIIIIIVATCGGRSETIPCFKFKPVKRPRAILIIVAEIAAMEANGSKPVIFRDVLRLFKGYETTNIKDLNGVKVETPTIHS